MPAAGLDSRMGRLPSSKNNKLRHPSIERVIMYLSSRKFLLFLLACLAMAIVTPAFADPAPGTIVVHYKRKDNKYDGWGMHIWSSRGEIPGVKWNTPVMPSGKDDFGVIFTLKQNLFPDDKVNYILHKGESKDQGGKDMFFIAKEAREVWIVSGSRDIHISKEAALAAAR